MRTLWAWVLFPACLLSGLVLVLPVLLFCGYCYAALLRDRRVQLAAVLFLWLPGAGSGLACGMVLSTDLDHHRAAIDWFPFLTGFGWGMAAWCGGVIAYAELLGWRPPPDLHAPSCEVCRYSLRGNRSGVCPECGTRVAWSQDPRRARRAHSRVDFR